MNYQELWEQVVRAQIITLKVRRTIKIEEREGKLMTIEKWVTEEILMEIKRGKHT